MATLKQLAYQVAGIFERNDDFLFIERVKSLIIAQRATWIHRETDKYGLNEQYIQPYDADLILVNASEVSAFPSDRQYLRSANKIPTPIRYQADVPFYYVGSLDGTVPFRYTRGHSVSNLKFLKYIGTGIAYFWENNYIYIVNNIKLEKIRIKAIYNSLDVTNNSGTGICYEEDMEFPLSLDQQNLVLADVINILRSGNDIKEKAPTATRDIN